MLDSSPNRGKPEPNVQIILHRLVPARPHRAAQRDARRAETLRPRVRFGGRLDSYRASSVVQRANATSPPSPADAEREVRGVWRHGEYKDGHEILAGAGERAEVVRGDAHALGLPVGRAAHELVERALEDGGDTARARGQRSPSRALADMMPRRRHEGKAKEEAELEGQTRQKPARRRWSDDTRYPESFSSYVLASARAGCLGARAPVKRVYDDWAAKLHWPAVSTPLRLKATSVRSGKRLPARGRSTQSHAGPAFTRARLASGPRRARAPHAARPTDARAVMRGQLASQVGGVPSPAREARLACRDVRMTGTRPNAFAKPWCCTPSNDPSNIQHGYAEFLSIQVRMRSPPPSRIWGSYPVYAEGGRKSNLANGADWLTAHETLTYGPSTSRTVVAQVRMRRCSRVNKYNADAGIPRFSRRLPSSPSAPSEVCDNGPGAQHNCTVTTRLRSGQYCSLCSNSTRAGSSIASFREAGAFVVLAELALWVRTYFGGSTQLEHERQLGVVCGYIYNSTRGGSKQCVPHKDFKCS
ncbi:hypothetical protein FB451DRAFT_1452198 [Mycena latifolia]|nr:hypothetical protein FB451DRAFT_1452198 [Mycena latifolia]